MNMKYEIQHERIQYEMIKHYFNAFLKLILNDNASH